MHDHRLKTRAVAHRDHDLLEREDWAGRGLLLRAGHMRGPDGECGEEGESKAHEADYTAPLPGEPYRAIIKAPANASIQMTDNTDLTDKEIDRRAFVARSLAVGAALAAPAGPAPPNASASASAGLQANDELFELTIADARARMEKGSLTSHALTQRYLSRIDAMDKRGPASTRSSSSIPTRSRSPMRWTPSERPAKCADRCTASRC